MVTRNYRSPVVEYSAGSTYLIVVTTRSQGVPMSMLEGLFSKEQVVAEVTVSTARARSNAVANIVSMMHNERGSFAQGVSRATMFIYARTQPHPRICVCAIYADHSGPSCNTTCSRSNNILITAQQLASTTTQQLVNATTTPEPTYVRIYI